MPDAPHPLTEEQRRLMQRHLPLVHLQLRRQSGCSFQRRNGREPEDLFQEGCLALAEAVRRYDSSRHGRFAPYALARIHTAMSVWLHEQTSPVRVPYATQKRRRYEAAAGKRRHDPGEPRPCVYDVNRRRARRFNASKRASLEPTCGVTVGEMIRERYDAAVEEVYRGDLRRGRLRPDSVAVLGRIVRERLCIPSDEARTSIRALMREMHVPFARVTHCESRFVERLRRKLLRDAAFRYLRRLSRHKPDGMNSEMSEGERQRVIRAARRTFTSDSRRVGRRLSRARASRRAHEKGGHPPAAKSEEDVGAVQRS
jgi:RNA polymerase sigma factor (sigma-70 family)